MAITIRFAPVRVALITCLFFGIFHYTQAQVVISSETFDEAAGATLGTMSGGEPWSALGGNCDATGSFGTNGAGAFACVDYEGLICCDCAGNLPNPAGTCGDASNEILLGPVDISAYDHISIDVFAAQSGAGVMECVVDGNPDAPCPAIPLSGCNGGSDQMIFSYRIDGGPWTVFQYYCGDNALCYSQNFACNISGNSVEIQVLLGTQAVNETYFIQDIIIYGYPDAGAEAAANMMTGSTTACAGSVINLSEVSSINNVSWMWSGPGVVGPSMENTTATVPNTPGSTVTYTVVTTDAFGCTASGMVAVGITSPPTMVDPPNISVCVGAPIDVVFSGSSSTATYSWTNSNTNTGVPASGSGDISATANNTGSGTIVVTPSEGGGCTGPTQSFTVTVNTGPTMNAVASISRCSGQTASVTFTGGPVGTTYSWTNDNTNINLGASGTGNISAFTTTAPNGTQEEAIITVTPSIGGCPGPEQTFTITVNPGPTVLDPPNLNLCEGDAIDVFFDGSSPTATYSWTNNNVNIGVLASGTGNISEPANNPGTAPITGTITVTPSEGSCMGPSQSFTVTVNTAPVMNAVASISRCSGQTASVTFSGGPVGTTYAWVNTNTNIGLGTSGTGNIPTFTTSAPGGTQEIATITVTPSIGGCPGPAQTFTITINPGPTVMDPPNLNLCEGEAIDVVFSGSSPTATYSWTNSNVNIGVLAAGTGNISQPSNNPGTTPITGTITVTPSEGGCMGPSQSFTVTVNVAPMMTAVPSISRCAGQTAAVTFTGGPTGTTYSWLNNNTNIGLGFGGIGNIPSFTTTAPNGVQEIATITVTPSIGGCPGPDQTFTITVNSGPSVMDPANLNLCVGDPINVVFSGSSPTASYAWTNNNINIGVLASGTSSITQTATNTATTPITGTITVIASEGGCDGTPQSFTITVNPVPTMTAIAAVVRCEGQTASVPFSGAAGTSYSWTNSNTSIGLGAAGTGDIPVFTTMAPGGLPQTANIVVTPSLGGCPGAPQNFSITVNTLPTLTVGTITCAPDLLTYQVAVTSNAPGITATQGVVGGGPGMFTISQIPIANDVTITATSASNCPIQQVVNPPNCSCPPIAAPIGNNAQICQGVTIPAFSVTVGAGLQVNWFSNPSGGLPLLTNSVSFTPTAAGTYYAEALDPATGCTSATRTPLTLTINALPTASISGNLSICSGSSVVLTATGGSTYQWSGTGGTAANATYSNVLITTMYTVTATDVNTCTDTETVTVQVTTMPTLVVGAITCAIDLLTYSVNITSTGGVVTSSAGTVTATAITGIPIATTPLTITVTSAANSACLVTASVNAPNCSCPPIVAPMGSSVAICQGVTIPALTTTVGTGLQVNWYSAATGGTVLQTNSTTFTPTVAGTYYAEAIDTSTGCTSTTRTAITLTINALPTASISGPLDVCTGSNVDLTATGGTNYQWTGSGGSLANATYLNVLTNTSYTVTVTDLNNCTDTETIAVQVTAIPTLTIGAISCAADLLSYSVNVTATGGTITSSAGVVSGNVISGIPIATNPVTITVTSPVNNSCTVSVPVQAPNCNCPPIAAPTGNSVPVCQGTPIPALTVIVGAGLQVNWYNASTGGTLLLANSTSFTPTAAGTYYAEALDPVTGCTSNSRTALTITINPLPTLTVGAVTCAPNNLTYSVSFTAVGGTVTTSAGTLSGNMISGIPVVTNPVNITVTSTVNTTCAIVVPVDAPSCACPPVAAPTGNNIQVCQGVSLPALTATIAPGLQVNWYSSPTGGIALLTNNTSFTPVSAGTYYAESFDPTTGCVSTTRTALSITTIAAPVASVAGTNEICVGEMATLTATPAGNTYKWSNNATNQAITVSPLITSTYSVIVTNTDLCADTAQFTVTVHLPYVVVINQFSCDPAAVGTVNLMLTTIHGCDSLVTIMTIQDLSPVCAPDVIVTNGSVDCSGDADGSISFTITDGFPPYMYSWAGNGFNGTGQLTTNATELIEDLTIGTYTITVTGANGVSTQVQGTVTGPPALSVDIVPVLKNNGFGVSCYAATDGALNVTTTGGTTPYQFLWSNGQTSNNITGLGASTFTVTVMDSKGCTAIASGQVTQPPAVLFGWNTTDPGCGAEYQVAVVAPTGGSQPYQYFLDGALQTSSVLNIPAGTHVIGIEDEEGCTVDTTVTITLPPPVIITLPSDTTILFGQELNLSAQTNLNVWNQLVWTPTPDTSRAGTLQQIWTPLSSQAIRVTITDTLGCQATDVIRILVNKDIDIYVPNTFTPGVAGDINSFWRAFGGVSIDLVQKVHVFDRWGNEVYLWDQPAPLNAWTGWDGKVDGKSCNPGVYVYYIQLLLKDGQQILLKGDVTLLR